ncbi:MAG: DMT family transporter [Myxococcales bacterium]|nr:DMT family transporter [Myxococcales bacterium]
MRAILLTAAALMCFAANSILCRLALAERHIDATSFTAIRLLSGALVLLVLARGRATGDATRGARWISAAALFAYAAPFSYAYLRLGAAMGALILFASVQVTMVGWGVVRGERPSALGWLGIVVAMAGLVGLTAPGKGAPEPIGAVAMALAGAAWGAYSLRGRLASGDPIATTSSSFTRSLPFAIVLFAAVAPLAGAHATPRGVALAAASGALASGAGYSVWYAALRHLSATRAAVLQLLVPVLAAAGGVAWLGERVSTRLLAASVAMLGGVALTIRDRATRAS